MTGAHHPSQVSKNSRASGGDKMPELLDCFDGGDARKKNDSGITSFTINRKYAKEFEERRRKTDLVKAKKAGILDDSESDSEIENEDEDGSALTGGLDFDIMKTISLIKSKDKRIYDAEYKPFEKYEQATDNKDEDESDVAEKNTKPIRYKDIERERIIRKMNRESDDESNDTDDDDDSKLAANSKSYSYVENQENLKTAFLEAATQSSELEEGDEEEGDILKIKSKTKAERQKEDDDYQRYLSTLKSKDQSVLANASKGDIGLVQKMFQNEPENENEAFLRKFFLQQGWISKDGNEEVESDSEDEREVEEAEEFERNYNFRFEEPDSHMLASHPRKAEASVRRKESSRHRQREQKRERVRDQKQKAAEEIRRLKALKMKEINDRLQALAESAGLESNRKAFTEQDLEADFDPDDWDKKMANMFNDDYYQEEDDEMDQELEAELDSVDHVKKFLSKHGMDEVDNDNEEDNVEVLEKKKSNDFDNAETSVRSRDALRDFNQAKDDAKEELNRIHYEDVIGGETKTRFKYRKVKPNSYGLSFDEIWNADHRDLQAMVSLKTVVAPYRDSEFVVDTKRRRRFRRALKETLQKRNLVQENNVSQSVPSEKTDDKVDKEANSENVPEEQDSNEVTDSQAKKKRSRKRKRKAQTSADNEHVSRDIAEADTDFAVEEGDNVLETDVIDQKTAGVPEAKKKRKRKHKKKINADK